MLDAPSCAFQIGTIRAPIPWLVFGKARARRAATVATSAFASETLTPGLSLTMAWKFRASRSAFAGQWRWYPAVHRDSRKIAVKFRRRHADDGDLVPVNAHGAAENGRVAPEILLPQPVADDRRERSGPVAIFVASERAAQGWLYAQDVEVVSGDQFEPRGIGVLSVADRGGNLLVQQQSGDASEAVLEVPAVGIGNARSLDAAGVDGFQDGELSVVRGTAERVQDHPIDPAKDCGGGGNTERQGKHCDRCPGRGSTEDTGCVTEVFEDAAHRVPAFKAIGLPTLSV